MSRRLTYFIFAFFAISVGLYPLAYFVADMSNGLLGAKSPALLQDQWWNIAFYQHIIFGGISLLTGWSQFNARLRARRLELHRLLGKIYMLSVLLSGAAGLYIAFFATGGTVSKFGFGSLAVLWLSTTLVSYLAIRRGQVERHRQWMIRSYALAFAAVTLRLWLPALTMLGGMDFEPAYRLIAWLCWVPNLAVAEWLIFKTIPLSSGS